MIVYNETGILSYVVLGCYIDAVRLSEVFEIPSILNSRRIFADMLSKVLDLKILERPDPIRQNTMRSYSHMTTGWLGSWHPFATHTRTMACCFGLVTAGVNNTVMNSYIRIVAYHLCLYSVLFKVDTPYNRIHAAPSIPPTLISNCRSNQLTTDHSYCHLGLFIT